VREVSDIAALVAARQDRVLPLETLDKLRVNPYLLNQVALNPDMRQQITEKPPGEATNALWKGFLEERDELLGLLGESGYAEMEEFYRARFFGEAFETEKLKTLPFGEFLYEAFMSSVESLKRGEQGSDWRLEWLKFLEYNYFSGSFLAGVLRYVELRFQTIAGISYALLRTG